MIEAWSPDGRFLLYNAVGERSGRDVWALPLAGDRKPLPLIQDPSAQGEPQISPNGRWVAYRSTESGRYEVCVQNFPPSGGKWQVSTAGGTEPKWRRDGKELFYIADNMLMAAEVKTDGSTFEAGIPKPLFEVRLPPMLSRSRFEATGDGQRFLVNTPAVDAGTPSITVVLNWPAGMRR